MLALQSHRAFLARLRWALRAQHVFGVSSLVVDKQGHVTSGSSAPKYIWMLMVLFILMAVWFVHYNNETPIVCKSNASKVKLFYYFVILETMIAIVFKLVLTIKIAWPASQQSLAQCWSQLIAKVHEFQVSYHCNIESKREFQLFWLWLTVLLAVYGFLLTFMVATSKVLFMVQTNHYIIYGLRIYAYLSDTTVCASFGLFALLLKALIEEMRKMVRQSNISENQLRSMIQLYRHILQIIESLCAVYGWVLIMILFEHFLIITDRSFFAIRMYRRPMGFTLSQVISMMMTWVFPLALNDTLLVGSCTATEKALKEFEQELCELGKMANVNKVEHEYMITCFSLYVAEQKPKFRILKSLNLNFNVIYAACGVIATYLTVFLQFDNGDSN
uniref:Gustatory receptor n=1 Tax=Anopheles epiroticus TaxID=199890 RepID=A0A182PNP7_9DIPT